MNKRKYKAITLFLILVFYMCSCSTYRTDKQNESTTIIQSTFDLDGLKEDLLDFKQLYFLRPSKGSVPGNYDIQEAVISEINKILETRINTVINIEYIIYKDQVQETFSRIQSGDNVDIVDSLSMLNDLEKYVEELNIADLTGRLPRYYPEIYEGNVDFSDIFINDKIYVMPGITVKAYQDRVCLVVNREMYKKAGSPKIQTVDDIVKLYEFGLENEDSRGRKFLDDAQKRYFIFEFHSLLQLYCQENGYQMDNWLFVTKDENMFLIEDTNLLEEWFHIVKTMCDKNAVMQTEPYSHILNKDLVMGLTYFKSISNMAWTESINQKYTVLFVNEYEPYSQKLLKPLALICDNENVDRSIIALRLLYEDKQLNRLIQYGIPDTHYKVNSNNRVEMIIEPGFNISAKDWWSSLVNGKFRYPMVHEPDGAEEYIASLYQFPRQVIPGVSNFRAQGALEFIDNYQSIKDAFNQRTGFIFNRLRLYKDTITEGLPYEIFIQESLDRKKQKELLQAIQIYIENLQ